MKKTIFFLLIALSVISCSKKSDNSASSGYTNKLELGTGLNPNNLFLLTGVGTTFSSPASLYFRLEAADDMAGSAVRLTIDKQGGGQVSTQDYPNPQSYGHIFISNFSVEIPGSYKATGILVTGNKTIASVNFVVN